MRIENLKLEKNGINTRSGATVIWEDCDRPKQEVYFETVDEFADCLSCNPHAFLVACIMPALHFGEERITIGGNVCPELKDGLITAMNWIRLWWYKPAKKLVKIEAKTTNGLSLPRTPHRAGFLFSGGIDSLSTLRTNRLQYSVEHPRSIKDGLLVCGLEIREQRIFEYVLNSLTDLAKDADITLIPLHTNIRSLGPENNNDFWGDFWLNKSMGATFSAISHALAKRLTEVSINSCHDIPNLIPYSSHPLVNPNYSSSNLRIRHEGIILSRFEKTKLVSGWDLALQHLRVCNKTEDYQIGRLNCGKCEKCVRTMLALLALGLLDKSQAFPIHDVSEELVMNVVQLAPNTFPLYKELLIPLTEAGRDDLVRAIERRIAIYYQTEKKKKWRQLIIEPIKEFDANNLGGTIRRVKRLVYSRAILGKG
jgi:hypothetical protein